jgi:GNAT superfamily N-acetyltransferase
MVGDLQIDRLGRADLADAVALSTEAQWNQTPADWARLLDLAPEGCFAGRLDGRLVATATAAGYGTAAFWIGMVIVARAHRGRGHGTALLRRAVQHARDRGARLVGLDATDLGRPVYLAQGFADVAPIDRWLGALAPGAPEATVAVDRAVDLDGEALRFDREACGLDRSLLLMHLAGEPGASAWVARRRGQVAGLAFLRPGRQHAHLGPVVAEPGPALPALLDAVAGQLSGGTVLVDAPRDERVGQLLAGRGLAVQRRLQRMTLPRAQVILMSDRVAAATSFEWG